MEPVWGKVISACSLSGGILPLINARQVRRTVTRGGWRSVEVVYRVTSMSMVSAAPLRVAAWVRGNWAIANRLHWVRDVTFDEARSAVRTGR